MIGYQDKINQILKGAETIKNMNMDNFYGKDVPEVKSTTTSTFRYNDDALVDAKTINAYIEELEEKEELINRAFEEWSDNDTKIEKMLEPILGKEFIEGNSYCVPGAVCCVEELVKKYDELKLEKDALWVKTQEDEREINDLRDINNELRKELEKLKELHTLNFMSDMLPMEKLQKQRDETIRLATMLRE